MPSLDSTICDPRMAALQAVHLVSQILDEAYVIANAAKESGDPWRHMSLRMNNMSHVVLKGELDNVTQNKEERESANAVATSTPQKNSEIFKKTEINFIGQGDVDCELQQNELHKSTSVLISNLFDMSDVERVIIYDDNDVETLHADIESNNESLTQAMSVILESYVNTALNIAFEEEPKIDKSQTLSEKSSKCTKYSSYSFLADALITNFGTEIVASSDDVATSSERIINELQSNSQKNAELSQFDIDKTHENTKKYDVALYENAYVSLNRDYEQCSDEEVYPVLQDPKGLSLQEVELLTGHTSEENLSCGEIPAKELAAVSTVSAGDSSRKSTWSRCRMQGARLLACIRGWWRKKIPRKHKQYVPVSSRGLCPLSPEARRRAASLMDPRHLRSPSPSRSAVWKFNTINETLVTNSTHWKDYTFEINSNKHK